MSAGKYSKDIKNHFFLITGKVAQANLKIEHRPTVKMWADVNTKPTQGKRFRVVRGGVMGVPMEYNDSNERRCTHLILMPKVESEKILVADSEVPEKAAIVIPARSPAKNPKRDILRGVDKESIPP